MKNTFLPFLLIFLFYSCTQDSEIESNQFNTSNITFPCGLDENGNGKQRIKCEPEDEVIKNNILTSLEFNNSFDWNSDLETAYGSPAFDLALVENGNNWTSLVLPVYRTSDRSISSIIRYYKTDTLNSYTFIDRKTNEWYLIDFNTFENKVNDFYFKLFDYGVCNSNIVPDYPDDDFEESLLCEADAGIYEWDPCPGYALKNENEADTRDPCDVWTFSEWQTVIVPCPPTSNGGGSGSGGSGGGGGGGGGGGDGDGGGGNNGSGGPNPGGGGNGSGSNGGWNTGGYNPTQITKAEAINNYQFLCSYLDNLACSTMLNILQTESQSCYSKLQAAANFLKDKGYNNFAAQSSLICALNAVSTSSGNPNNPPCTGALSPPYEVAVQLNNRLFEHHNTFPNLETGVCSILNTNFTPQNRSELADYVTNLIDQYITNNPSLPIGANNYLPQSIYDEINLAINVQSFKQFYELNKTSLSNLMSKIPITCLQSSNFNECSRISVIESFNLIDKFGFTQQELDDFKNNFFFQNIAVSKIDWSTSNNTQKISQIYYSLALISFIYEDLGGDHKNSQYSLNSFFNNTSGTIDLIIDATINMSSLPNNKKINGKEIPPISGVKIYINEIWTPKTFHWGGINIGSGNFQHFYFPKTGSDEWGFSILDFIIPYPVWDEFIANFYY